MEAGIKGQQIRNSAYSQVRFLEEALYAFVAELCVILLRAKARILFEHAAEIGVTHVKFSGKIFDGNCLIDSLSHKKACPSDCGSHRVAFLCSP